MAHFTFTFTVTFLYAVRTMHTEGKGIARCVTVRKNHMARTGHSSKMETKTPFWHLNTARPMHGRYYLLTSYQRWGRDLNTSWCLHGHYYLLTSYQRLSRERELTLLSQPNKQMNGSVKEPNISIYFFFPPTIQWCSISDVLFTGGRGVSGFRVLKYY